MANRVTLVHPINKITKKSAYGFSWTTLFWGFWPALLRGDYVWFGIGLAAAFAGLFSFGIVPVVYQIVMAFIYNGIHGRSLIEKGYALASGEGENLCAARKWGVTNG